jgi:hypothetical protein
MQVWGKGTAVNWGPFMSSICRKCKHTHTRVSMTQQGLKYCENPQLRPPLGLVQSGLNCGVVLNVNILIAYIFYDHGVF